VTWNYSLAPIAGNQFIHPIDQGVEAPTGVSLSFRQLIHSSGQSDFSLCRWREIARELNTSTASARRAAQLEVARG